MNGWDHLAQELTMPQRESPIEEVADVKDDVETQLAFALTTFFKDLEEALKASISAELVKRINDDIRLAEVAVSLGTIDSEVLRRI